MLAANEYVMRFDPTKPIVWYFDKGFPPAYKAVFNGPGGIAEQTNAMFTAAGVTAQLSFKEYNEDMDPSLPADMQAAGRQFGDVRYNFLRWMSDKDEQSYWAGVTQFVVDPRTGQTFSGDIVFNDFAIKDYYVQRLDAFLQYMGASNNINSAAEWPDGPANCKDGDTMPILPDSRAAWAGNLDPVPEDAGLSERADLETYGNLAPSDFIRTQNITDTGPGGFQGAYYAILPYEIFADPDMNSFVVREGGAGVYGSDSIWQMRQTEAAFHKLAGDIDKGGCRPTTVQARRASRLPLGSSIPSRGTWRTTRSSRSRTRCSTRTSRLMPPKRSASRPSFSATRATASTACGRPRSSGSKPSSTRTGRRSSGTSSATCSVSSTTSWARSTATTSPRTRTARVARTSRSIQNSVMEYNAAPDRVFWHAGWAPYDRAAITWIYANNAPTTDTPNIASISGQIDATKPWKDQNGFDATGKIETQFLRCDEHHLTYTPLCRQGDLGTTPSEIIANAIEMYEWEYNWRNFRTYRKYWDESNYADAPAGMTIDMRKFISQWVFDWDQSDLQDVLQRIGYNNPDPNGSNADFYAALTNKFNAEMSQANQLVAAFHKAVVQQGSGERPFATVYDKFYGDVTQQGIILDKLFAVQGWVGMWPTDNYDQNQAGAWLASYSGIGDDSYAAVAEDAVDSMVGGQYDVYPYARPLAVVQFAKDTHDPSFSGRLDVRDWVGGHVFWRLEDFLAYFQNIAVQNGYPGCTTTFATCTYDPRAIPDPHNEFIAPDKRVWIWAFIPDRGEYVAVLKDRNTASYLIVRNYNDDVVNLLDDGLTAYGLELPIKYMMDAFTTYE